jgi:CRP-like cAMP-binding protein
LLALNKEYLTFALPLSRVEMAQLAGTTKESLIRTLTEFKHDKIIDLEERNLTIVSLEIIQTLSRFG